MKKAKRPHAMGKRNPMKPDIFLTDPIKQNEADSLLQLERDFVKRIVSASPILICGIEPDGTTRFLNPAGVKIIGYTLDEIRGRSWWETLLPGELHHQLEEMLNAFGLNDVEGYEIRIKAKNGEDRTLLWSSSYFFTETGAMTEEVGFGVEISERNEFEKQLFASKRWVDEAQRIAQLGSWEWDIANERAIISDEGCRILGMEEADGHSSFQEFLKHVHPDDQKIIQDGIKTALQKGGDSHFDFRVLLADGSVRSVHHKGTVLLDYKGEPTCLIGTILDVTEHKEIQASLKVSNEELEKLVRDRTVELVKANIKLEGDIAIRKKAEKALKEKSRQLKKLNKDLEKRVQEEIERRRKKEQLLIEQSKLAAMGEMLTAIAHHWRQPLNAIGLILQDFGDAYDEGEISREYIEEGVEKAMKQLNYMSSTIDNFRNFVKGAKAKTTFQVSVVIREVLSIITLPFQHAFIEVKCEFSENELSVFGNSNELKQVLLNLLNNAKDAIIDRNTAVNSDKKNGLITIQTMTEKGELHIHVTDTGGGIPHDKLERIFEPYFSLKEEGKGSGVGLYMARLIIEKNFGGRLYAKNQVNGATFTIELPPSHT